MNIIEKTLNNILRNNKPVIDLKSKNMRGEQHSRNTVRDEIHELKKDYWYAINRGDINKADEIKERLEGLGGKV